MKELADLILAAVLLHESSWDAEAGVYFRTIKEACDEQALNEESREIAEMLLYNCWNEVQDWATRVVAKSEAESLK
jgi:hypothetical protein